VSEIAERGGKALATQGDVSKPDDVKQLFEDVVREFGGLDVLVNNAGVYSFGPLDSVTEAEFYDCGKGRLSLAKSSSPN